VGAQGARSPKAVCVRSRVGASWVEAFMKGAEVREMNDEVLTAKLAETKQELFNLRFQHATGQLENTARLGALKRDIARLTGELRVREIAAAESQA